VNSNPRLTSANDSKPTKLMLDEVFTCPCEIEALARSLACCLELESESRRMRGATDGISEALAKFEFRTLSSSIIEEVDNARASDGGGMMSDRVNAGCS
jgi:hypothetical protein